MNEELQKKVISYFGGLGDKCKLADYTLHSTYDASYGVGVLFKDKKGHSIGFKISTREEGLDDMLYIIYHSPAGNNLAYYFNIKENKISGRNNELTNLKDDKNISYYTEFNNYLYRAITPLSIQFIEALI